MHDWEKLVKGNPAQCKICGLIARDVAAVRYETSDPRWPAPPETDLIVSTLNRHEDIIPGKSVDSYTCEQIIMLTALE